MAKWDNKSLLFTNIGHFNSVLAWLETAKSILPWNVTLCIWPQTLPYMAIPTDLHTCIYTNVRTLLTTTSICVIVYIIHM